MEGYIPMVVETTVFVIMMGIVVTSFKLLTKIRADEDLFASILFLKKDHIHNIALLTILSLISLSASSIVDLVGSIGGVEILPLLNETFRFNSMALLFFSIMALHQMMKITEPKI